MHRFKFQMWLVSSLMGFALLLTDDAAYAKSPFSLVRFTRSKDVAKSSHLLTEDNGPWMIFAGSFAGQGAENDARQLVQELRSRYRLAAYLHKKNYDFTQSVEGQGFDKFGSRKRMRYSSWGSFDEVAVLVGDYSSLNDPKLQKHLNVIKYSMPQSLTERGRIKATTLRFAGLRQYLKSLTGDKEQKKKGPLGRAFATKNPILSREMIAPQGLEPLLVNLNKGQKYSLLDCPGKYTVRVASFRGHVVIDQREVSEIEKGKSFKSQLHVAGEKAERLVALLRKHRVEAYVFHDRYESIATVGSFDEIGRQLPDGTIDLLPSVGKIMERYGPARKPVRGRNGVALTGFQPRALGGYVFDVAPQPVLVPRRSIGSDYLSRR